MKVYNYLVRMTGDFGGCRVETLTRKFDSYEEAKAYYDEQIASFAHWCYPPEAELIDGIKEAEEKLAELKNKVAELEKAIEEAKKIRG